uniref:Putative melanoma-associated antigen b1-like protein n=1 Tax=Anopheles darlingi TaxID=43151 RepID=A0A2M4CJ30_ANODA
MSWEWGHMNGSRVGSNVFRSMSDWEIVVVSITVSVSQTISAIESQRVHRLQSVDVGLNDGRRILRSVVTVQTIVVGRVW